MRIGESSSKAIRFITREEEISEQNRKLLILLVTVAAAIFGCLYYQSEVGYFWKLVLGSSLADFLLPSSSKKEVLNFKHPDLVHCLAGLVLLAPMYIRKILPWKGISPFNLLMIVLNMFWFAALAQIVLGSSETLSHTWTQTFLIAAILLTWLGIRSVAGLSWILAFGFAAYCLISASNSMKHFGLLFLVSSVLSMLLQSRLSPKEFFEDLAYEFRGISEGEYSGIVRENVHAGVEAASRAIEKGSNIAVTAISI
jgi:hypothetical protein